MKPSIWLRLDRWARQLTPFGFTFILVVVSVIPLQVPGFARVVPFLALIVSMAGCGGDSGGGEAANAAAAVPVTTAIARTGEVESRLHSVGRFVSENAPRLAAEVAARVEDVLVEEGETVSAGQVLVRLDPTAFELSSQEARAAILALDVSIANGERRVARYRDLKSTNALSQERLDDAESALAADRAALAAACRCNKTYPSLEEMVKDDSIEAIFCATDAPSHARHCIEVLKHGKHAATAVPAVLGSI